MNKRKPESKFEILPYDEVFHYGVSLFIVDISTYKSSIIEWLDIRTKNIEDNSDIHMKLSISSEGFHMTLHHHEDKSYLMSMRINHVVALQLKQACEHYIKCYDEHRLQNDITIYDDVKHLHH